MVKKDMPIVNVPKFFAGIFILICGALLLAESVVSMVTGEFLFFVDVNRGFEFLIGFIFIILAAIILDDNRKK